MKILVLIIRFEIWFILIGLFSIVSYQMLTGKINTRGLLKDKTSDTFSPSRVQMLVLTFIGTVIFLSRLLGSLRYLNPTMPEIPDELLLAMGGSHAFYLFSKAKSMNVLALLFGSDSKAKG